MTIIISIAESSELLPMLTPTQKSPIASPISPETSLEGLRGLNSQEILLQPQLGSQDLGQVQPLESLPDLGYYFLPDLTITSISATNAIPGSYLNFNYTIANYGDDWADPTYTTFYLSRDLFFDSNDYYLGYDEVDYLNAGYSSRESASLYIDSNLSSGTYYLLAYTDEDDYLWESNENNNLVYKTVSVTAPAQPDLVINGLKVGSGVPGSYLDFSYSIKNQGNGSADYSYTAFYLSRDQVLDGGDTYLDYDYVSPLSAGATRTETASVYLDSYLTGGTYYLFAAADDWNDVNESNGNNNVFYQAFTVGTPDLSISSINVTSGIPGSSLNFSYSVKNQGGAAAGYNYTAFYLSKDNKLDATDTYLGYDDVASLAAGATRSENASVYLSSNLTTGTYYLFADTDGWDDVWESNENNNLAFKILTINPPQQDLVVSNITTKSATAGGTLQFSYTAKNQGKAAITGSTYTAFYLSKDTKLDNTDIYLDYGQLPALAAGASLNRSGSVSLNSNLAAGTYYLFVQLDGWDYLAEANESNNLSYQAVTITGAPKPDLSISNISALAGTAGGNLNFNYTIDNKGNAIAPASSTGFYLSKDTVFDQSDVYLGLDAVNSLAAGASSKESVSLALAKTLAAGSYYLLARADNANIVSENNEGNNIAYQEVVIAAAALADLTVTGITTPAGIAGNNLTFTYSLKNQGKANAGATKSYLYLSKDTQLDSNDTYLGVDDVKSLALGASSNESVTVALSKTLVSGTYYLLVKADAENNLEESLENNNVGSQTIKIDGSDGGSDWYSENLKDAGLISLARSLGGDGNLSRNDMISIFRNTKDQGQIDANEITDLRTLVSNATRFSISESVRVLSDYIVNGNPANQWWTGGTTNQTALGNLAVGSSETQMERLVGKWFLGSDRPDIRADGDSANQSGGAYTGDKTYRAISGSLFQNGIDAEDIAQGALGSCYYLAVLASIAQEKPSYIQNMFINNGDNTYTVRFFNNGIAQYVTVDNYLPTNSTGRLIYSSAGNAFNDSTNELWVALAEKAYAQLAESGWSRPGEVKNAYTSIEGGWMDYVTTQITGINATLKEVSTLTKNQLIALANSNQILTAGFVYGAGYGVVNGHAYTVSGYNAATGTFYLRNPWATQHASVTWEQLLDLKAILSWSVT